MKTTQKLIATILLSGSLIATPTIAQGVQKLGYVNPERVYTETKTAQRIEADLQREFGEQQKQLQALQQQGINLQKKLQDNKLAKKERQQAETQLIDISRQYRALAVKLGEEYSLRRNEEFAALQNNANNVIKNIAEQEKYDLIVQEAVFVSRKYDITDRVIKQLDEMK